jgi:hypothetical protein
VVFGLLLDCILLVRLYRMTITMKDRLDETKRTSFARIPKIEACHILCDDGNWWKSSTMGSVEFYF